MFYFFTICHTNQTTFWHLVPFVFLGIAYQLFYLLTYLILPLALYSSTNKALNKQRKPAQ